MRKRIPGRCRFTGLGLCLVVAISLAVISCGKSFQWEGKWVGTRELKAQPGEDQIILTSLGRIELNLLSTGKFDMFESGVPKGGTYRIYNGKAYLKVETYFNKPIEEALGDKNQLNQEVVLTPNEDRTITFEDPAGFDGKPIVLKRESQR